MSIRKSCLKSCQHLSFHFHPRTRSAHDMQCCWLCSALSGVQVDNWAWGKQFGLMDATKKRMSMEGRTKAVEDATGAAKHYAQVARMLCTSQGPPCLHAV